MSTHTPKKKSKKTKQQGTTGVTTSCASKLYPLFCPAPSFTKQQVKNTSTTSMEEIDSDEDDDDFEVSLSSLRRKAKENKQPPTTTTKQRQRQRQQTLKQKTKTHQKTTNSKKRNRCSTEIQQVTHKKQVQKTCSTTNKLDTAIDHSSELSSLSRSDTTTATTKTTTTTTTTTPQEHDEERNTTTALHTTTTKKTLSSQTSSLSTSLSANDTTASTTKTPSSTSTTSTIPKNIALQLSIRSCYLSRTRTSNLHSTRTIPTGSSHTSSSTGNLLFLDTPKWSMPSLIGLGSSSLSSLSSLGCGKATCFAWDELGVLLAVGIENQKQIYIYDWDTVVALDMSTKRKQHRQQQQEQQQQYESSLEESVVLDTDTPSPNTTLRTTRIQPTWTFSTPHDVSFLEWNPYKPDQLAVGFRTTSQLRLYDVSKIAKQAEEAAATTTTTRAAFSRRTSQQQQQQQQGQQQKTWITLQPSSSHVSRTHGIRSLLFLPSKHHVLVSHKYGPCTLWKIPKQSQSQSSLQPQWYYHGNTTNEEEISDMIPIGSHFVLLGGSLGNITLLNWRQCTRKAFSSQSSPIIECQWDTYDKMVSLSLSRSTTTTTTTSNAGWGGEGLPTRSWMGIQRFLKKPEYINTCSNKKMTTWVKQNIVWVTKCGWVMSLKVDMLCNNDTKRGGTVSSSTGKTTRTTSRVVVLRTSPRQEIRNEKGEIFQHEQFYSLPSSAPATDSIDNCLVWYETPKTTRILPHLDKRVLGDVSLIHPNHTTRSTTNTIGSTTTILNNMNDDSRTTSSSSSSPETKLSFMDTKSNKIMKINLPRRNCPPLAIALHPNQEWMVVAGDDGSINLLNRNGIPNNDNNEESKAPIQEE